MRFAVLLIALMVAGCADVPPQMIYVPADMLPKVAKPSQNQARFAGQTLVVAPVTGVGASSAQALSGALLGASVLGTSVIWAKTFREALIEGLQDAALFGNVSRAGTSRYVLQAELLQQAPAGYGATITVRYALNDTQSDRDIWSEDIAATYSFSLNPATFLAPGNTQYRALMRACGKNIESLIAKLAALPNVAAAQ
jgi:hypothetical protein